MTNSSSENGPYYYSFMPDQIKEDFTEDDYKASLRFIGSAWNQYVYIQTPYSINLTELGLPLGFAERSLVWRDFYFGLQDNIDYSGTILKEDGKRKLLKMFRGKDIFKYINYIQDNIIEVSKRIPKIISCTTISENVVSARRFQQDFDKFVYDQAEMTQYLQQKYQLYFKTPSGAKFQQNAQQQATSVDFRESLDEAAVNSARDIYYRNILNEQFVSMGRDASISGLAGCKVEIENGYPLIEWIPSYEAIFPMTLSGDQHRTDPYGGRIRFLTPQEVAAKYSKYLSYETLREIQDFAKLGDQVNYGVNGWSFYNSLGGIHNFKWWSTVDGVPRIACVEGQWASWKKEDADKYRQCKRQGILIGNRWAIECKESTNQPLDWHDARYTNLDYIFCQPMNVFGKNMGIPEILYTYQNRLDFLQTKLDEWINQTKGTFYLVNGAYLDEGVDATRVMSDISDMRMAVVKGVDEEAGDEVQKLMTQGAIEMPRDTVQVINQIAMYEKRMEDILNIPAAARGQLEGYQGTKTLNMQLSQSNKGTRYFYDPLYTFFARIIQRAVDKFKVSTRDNEEFLYTLIVSDTQVEQFKATKDFGYSQQAIYLGFEDIADDGFKQRQLEIVFADAQNPASGFTLLDYNTIDGMYTKTEINNYLQYRTFEIEQKKQAEIAAEREAAAAQSQQANETQQNIVRETQEGADRREDAKLESKENIEAAKLENDLRLKAMDLAGKTQA